jgi:uncharacterized RmlC-like cupin family protein
MSALRGSGLNKAEVMTNSDTAYWARQGARIRTAANDLKRTGDALADELGEPSEVIDAVFVGAADPPTYERVICRMVEAYPISRLDLEVRRDDTDEGVVYWTADAARASSRVFDRADRHGQLTPYYEYRDLAMSSVGPYRPEWIKELRVVAGDNPDDPDVAYNIGHMRHTITFFVGPVNCYWRDGDVSRMAQMDTGDSNYITPMVPHSFASRDASREALIVAVTFDGSLGGEAQQELAILDTGRLAGELPDVTQPSRAFSRVLQKEMATGMRTSEHLAARSGIRYERLTGLLDGTALPNSEEFEALAKSLELNVRDLMPPQAVDRRQVVVRHASSDAEWHYPSEELPRYRVQELAGSRKVPVNGMAVQVLESSPAASDGLLDLATSSHEFAYNYGDEPVNLYWRGSKEIRCVVVAPGDSYYVKPTTAHAVRALEGGAASVLMVRVGGALTGDSAWELASLPETALDRVISETAQWYDPKGRGG